jgi:hypothetical protein
MLEGEGKKGDDRKTRCAFAGWWFGLGGGIWVRFEGIFVHE